MAHVISPGDLVSVNDPLEVRHSGQAAPRLGSAGEPTELLVAATVAAAANNQTLAAAAGKRTYITGFHVGGLGATAASVIAVTVTGLLGGTLTYRFAVPAGVAAIAAGLDIEFARPVPASADNTAIVVNVPSFGAGNTSADASARGFSI